MQTWDLSASLVRVVILLSGAIAVPIVRYWVGGRWRSYLALLGGLLFLGVAEGLHISRLSTGGGFQAASIAWDSVYIHASGYMAVLLGLLFWVREFREARKELEQDNVTLKRAAAVDFLTDLVNRRQAVRYLERERARAKRTRESLAFIMVDLDHFKRINDTHGHQAGDAALKHAADLMKTRARTSDILIRYGGEEFLIVLPDTYLAGAMGLANSLRERIQDNPLTYGDVQVQLRASFGVAMLLPDEDIGVKDVIGRADKALYAAKEAGRNRVVAWEELPEAQDEPAAALAPAGAE
ncbi:MAG TPA: GGDEF domain-containing protein [Phycisphaerae bacterium]|nr:GGDEF domain-containing protein [Phycisphaerae bacterium]